MNRFDRKIIIEIIIKFIRHFVNEIFNLDIN